MRDINIPPRDIHSLRYGCIVCDCAWAACTCAILKACSEGVWNAEPLSAWCTCAGACCKWLCPAFCPCNAFRYCACKSPCIAAGLDWSIAWWWAFRSPGRGIIPFLRKARDVCMSGESRDSGLGDDVLLEHSEDTLGERWFWLTLECDVVDVGDVCGLLSSFFFDRSESILKEPFIVTGSPQILTLKYIKMSQKSWMTVWTLDYKSILLQIYTVFTHNVTLFKPWSVCLFYYHFHLNCDEKRLTKPEVKAVRDILNSHLQELT